MPDEAKIKVHQIEWKTREDCQGEKQRVKMVTISGKTKGGTNLKKTLRRITNLNIFYAENVEFKPSMLLNYINALKESVIGPEQSDNTNLKPEETDTSDKTDTEQILKKDKDYQVNNNQDEQPKKDWTAEIPQLRGF